MTSGAMPEYSRGQRIGYVTKVSHKGVIWKTWEIEVQMGAGEQAALQAPHRFSGGMIDTFDLKSYMGKRVVVDYREWLVLPYSIGSSGYEILDIKESK